jgi:tetratricopeptide (TPR) repeat protein
VLFRTEEGFRISGAVKQGQDLFRMPVDIALVSGASGTDSTKDNTANNTKDEILTVELIGKSTPFDISSFAMPQKIVLDPKNKILRDSRELRTAVQLALGDDLRQASNLVEAIRAYDDALKLSPQRSLAHFRLGETFFEQYNLQSAANAFRDALNGDKEPGWIEVWCYIYLGKIYDILGQRQRALAEYTKALNTKDDTNGAQAEASRWQAAPYVRERGIDGGYAVDGAGGTDGVDDASDGTGVPNDAGDAGDTGDSGTGDDAAAGELTPQP